MAILEVKNIENTSEEFADEFNNKTEYFLFSDVKAACVDCNGTCTEYKTSVSR